MRSEDRSIEREVGGDDGTHMEVGNWMDDQPMIGDIHCSLVSPGNDQLEICPDTEQICTM